VATKKVANAAPNAQTDGRPHDEREDHKSKNVQLNLNGDGLAKTMKQIAMRMSRRAENSGCQPK
jgi:hypothetical protein